LPTHFRCSVQALQCLQGQGKGRVGSGDLELLECTPEVGRTQQRQSSCSVQKVTNLEALSNVVLLLLVQEWRECPLWDSSQPGKCVWLSGHDYSGVVSISKMADRVVVWLMLVTCAIKTMSTPFKQHPQMAKAQYAAQVLLWKDVTKCRPCASDPICLLLPQLL
jgi:hypothetical protein